MNNMNYFKEGFVTKKYSALIGITAFLGWVLITEVGSSLIGGDLGSYLYVTFHFGLNPIMGFVLIAAVIWHYLKAKETLIKVLDLSSCIIPAAIIYTAISGSFLLSDLLGVKF